MHSKKDEEKLLEKIANDIRNGFYYQFDALHLLITSNLTCPRMKRSFIVKNLCRQLSRFVLLVLFCFSMLRFYGISIVCETSQSCHQQIAIARGNSDKFIFEHFEKMKRKKTYNCCRAVNSPNLIFTNRRNNGFVWASTVATRERDREKCRGNEQVLKLWFVCLNRDSFFFASLTNDDDRRQSTKWALYSISFTNKHHRKLMDGIK